MRTVSSTDPGSLATRLIVAGGGGGHSETYGPNVPPADAGADAQPATVQGGSGQGGFAGTQDSGGAGGQGAPPFGQPGTAGSLGQGGSGVSGFPSAGGGGGGLYGGGGGSGGDDSAGPGVAGGGGGGSSLVPSGGSLAPTTDPASVTITYSVAPADTTPPTSTATPRPGASNGLPVVTITGTQTFKNTAGTAVGTVNGTCYTTRGLALTLNATDTDTGSGVASLTYAATGAQTIPATTTSTPPATVPITAGGTTTVTYSATDNAGNAETPHRQTVWVAPNGAPFACTAPTTTFTPPAHGSVIITGTATILGRSVPFNQTIKY